VSNEFELWHFVAERLGRGESVMLLVVAESSGSSPGRAGYKMAVACNGELIGSIGGGIMEVSLVDQSRKLLCEAPDGVGSKSFLKPQIHRKNKPASSGMICSGQQTIILKQLIPDDSARVDQVIDSLSKPTRNVLRITPAGFDVIQAANRLDSGFLFEKVTEKEFNYEETVGPKNCLYIIGGGHCALALSELMSKMDFYIQIFDDRPDLNTVEKNRFAHEKHIIESYDSLNELIDSDANGYVVVMTLGFQSDENVIKQLINKDFKYFGVLGSEAKMATVLKDLKAAGIDEERLKRLHTPIGLPINSHSPEEIAVSIAAEIISIKNSDKTGRKKNSLSDKKIY
jgi:xanthine dehydrogenase accessory factor